MFPVSGNCRDQHWQRNRPGKQGQPSASNLYKNIVYVIQLAEKNEDSDFGENISVWRFSQVLIFRKITYCWVEVIDLGLVGVLKGKKKHFFVKNFKFSSFNKSS